MGTNGLRMIDRRDEVASVATVVAQRLRERGGLRITRYDGLGYEARPADDDQGAPPEILVLHLDRDNWHVLNGLREAGLLLTANLPEFGRPLTFGISFEGDVTAHGADGETVLGLPINHPMAVLLRDLRDRFHNAHRSGAIHQTAIRRGAAVLPPPAASGHAHTDFDVELLDSVARAIAPKIEGHLTRTNGITVTKHYEGDEYHAHADDGSGMPSVFVSYTDKDAPGARSGVSRPGLRLTARLNSVLGEVNFAIDPDGGVRAFPGTAQREKGRGHPVPLDFPADHPMTVLLADLRERFRAALRAGALADVRDAYRGGGEDVAITYPERGHGPASVVRATPGGSGHSALDVLMSRLGASKGSWGRDGECHVFTDTAGNRFSYDVDGRLHRPATEGPAIDYADGRPGLFFDRGRALSADEVLAAEAGAAPAP